MNTDERQGQFAERLGETLVKAEQVLDAEQVFEAAIAAACAFGLRHAPGPAIAETLRRMAGEMLSRRRYGDRGLQ